MDRRSFIKLLGGTAITVVTPKLIFDLGANLHKLPVDEVMEWRNALFAIDPKDYFEVRYTMYADSIITPNKALLLSVNNMVFPKIRF